MWHEVKKIDTNSLKSISRGEIAQLKIQLACAQRDITVAIPTIQVRFDLILEIKNKLYRTQIKHLNRVAGKNKNCLELLIEDKRYKNKKCYTKDQIDLLLIYISKLDCILCLYPQDFHNKKRLWFNLTNPKAPSFYKKFLW